MEAKISYSKESINQMLISVKKLIPQGKLFIITKNDCYGTQLNFSKNKIVFAEATFKKNQNFSRSLALFADTTGHYDYITISNKYQLESTAYSSKKVYLRVDPFLGGLGFSLKDLKKIKNIHEYHGLLIHFDEKIDSKAIKFLICLRKIAKKNNLKINLGGSIILNYPELIKKNDELRFLMNLIQPRNSTKEKAPLLFQIKCRLLNCLAINDKLSVGYFSTRRFIKNGTLLIVDIGYGNIPWIGRLYEKKIPIRINGHDYFLIAYPAMSHSWLWSADKNCEQDQTLYFIKNNSSLIDYADKLNVDVDELISQIKWKKAKVK